MSTNNPNSPKGLSIDQMVEQYAELSATEKQIAAQKKKLATSIKDYAATHGTADDKGSTYGQAGDYVYGRQARKSIKFNQEAAAAFFTLKKMPHALTTQVIVNEPIVESLVERGDISFEELESITTTTVTYAVVVSKKEDMPEVQVAELVPLGASPKSLPIAASTKPRSPLKPPVRRSKVQ